MIQHIYPNSPTALRDALHAHPGGPGTIYLHQRAHDHLGDCDGIYEESINTYDTPFLGGSGPGDRLLICAFEDEKIILRPKPPAGTGLVVILAALQTSYIELCNLTLDAVNCGGDAVKVTYSGPDPSNASTHLRLRSCEVLNSPMQGVLFTSGTDHEVLGCEIHHNGRTANLEHGIYAATQRTRVEDCDVHHNAAVGIAIHNQQMLERWVVSGDDADTLQGVIVRHNRCYANSQVTEPGRGAYGAGISVSTCLDARIESNVCWDNAIGIQIYTDNPYCYLIRNTLWSNATANLENQAGEEYYEEGTLYP